MWKLCEERLPFSAVFHKFQQKPWLCQTSLLRSRFSRARELTVQSPSTVTGILEQLLTLKLLPVFTFMCDAGYWQIWNE